MLCITLQIKCKALILVLVVYKYLSLLANKNIGHCATGFVMRFLQFQNVVIATEQNLSAGWYIYLCELIEISIDKTGQGVA